MSRTRSWTSILTLALLLVGARPLTAQEQRMPAPKKATAAPTASAPLNLNTATAVQLETLPGIGPTVAARIVEYRQKNGSFKKIEELMNVKGIGEKLFLKIKAVITIAPPKTSDK